MSSAVVMNGLLGEAWKSTVLLQHATWSAATSILLLQSRANKIQRIGDIDLGSGT